MRLKLKSTMLRQKRAVAVVGCLDGKRQERQKKGQSRKKDGDDLIRQKLEKAKKRKNQKNPRRRNTENTGGGARGVVRLVSMVRIGNEVVVLPGTHRGSQ